jgi:hypothetical protein
VLFHWPFGHLSIMGQRAPWTHIGMVYRRDGTTTKQHDKVMMMDLYAPLSHMINLCASPSHKERRCMHHQVLWCNRISAWCTRRDGTTTKQRDKVMMRHQVICWRSVCSSESSVGDLYAAIRSFPLYAPPSALVWSHIGMVYRRDGTTTQQHDKVMMRHEHATFSHLRYAPPSLLLYVLKLILIRIPIVVPPPRQMDPNNPAEVLLIEALSGGPTKGCILLPIVP